MSYIVLTNPIVNPTEYIEPSNGKTYNVYSFTDPTINYTMSFANVLETVPLSILAVGSGGNGMSNNINEDRGGGGAGGQVIQEIRNINDNIALSILVGNPDTSINTSITQLNILALRGNSSDNNKGGDGFSGGGGGGGAVWNNRGGGGGGSGFYGGGGGVGGTQRSGGAGGSGYIPSNNGQYGPQGDYYYYRKGGDGGGSAGVYGKGGVGSIWGNKFNVSGGGGGSGILTDLVGIESKYYGGGGGGSSNGYGGRGGGGNYNSNGLANTGGGGGGGETISKGGSGIVIIAIPKEIIKLTQTISTTTSNITTTYSPSIQIVNLTATTDSNLSLTYLSSNPSVATVNSSAGVVTIMNAGTASIYIDQAGNDTYSRADRVTIPVTVTKADQPVMQVPVTLTKKIGDTHTLTDPGFLGRGALSYSIVSGAGVASVNSSGIVTAIAPGSSTIRISKAADANYKGEFADINLTVITTVPSTPIIISVTKNGNNSITMNFTKPSSNGGSEITSYSYSVNDAAFVQIQIPMDSVTGSGTASSPYSYIITGLSSYNKIKLKATNEIGDSPVYTANEILLSNICFPASTPITTNQGNIPIEQLNPEIHTIRNKPIIGITQTITQDKYLVSFEKDAIGPNIPNQKTIISKNHCIFYKGKLIPAKEFIGLFENVKKVKYNGEILYNVIMEEHDKMLVNNLICETLHPENVVTKVYKVLKNLNPEKEQEMIKECNEYITKNKLYSSNSKK